MKKSPRLRESIVAIFGASVAATAAVTAYGEDAAPDAKIIEAPRQTQIGFASYYHDWLHGKPTASGAIYDKNAMTAAHSTLPLGARVKVTNVRNKRSVVLLINDRLPAFHRRIIDVSRAAARELGMLKRGVVKVKLQVLDSAAAVPTE